MKNDPDIVRWSQIKRFLKHTLFWMVVYGGAAWLFDMTRYSDHSALANFLMLLALSVFMAIMTIQKN